MPIVTLHWDGKSFDIELPEELVTAANLRDGDELDIKVVNGGMVLTPLGRKFDLTMEAAERVMARFRGAYAELGKSR